MTDARSRLELLFATQLAGPIIISGATFHLPKPERDYHFHPTRKWALDFAWPRAGHIVHPNHLQKPIAVEIEGGTYIEGRHSRGQGFEKDCEKYGEALILGWRVLRVTGEMVLDGRAIALTRRLFDA